MRVLEPKLRRCGNPLGIVLPKDVIQHLRKRLGERLFLVESQGGTYKLTSHVRACGENSQGRSLGNMNIAQALLITDRGCLILLWGRLAPYSAWAVHETYLS